MDLGACGVLQCLFSTATTNAKSASFVGPDLAAVVPNKAALMLEQVLGGCSLLNLLAEGLSIS